MDDVDKITPEQVRHFVKTREVGWRRAARMMAPDASEEDQGRLGRRIRSLIASDRRKAKATLGITPKPEPPTRQPPPGGKREQNLPPPTPQVHSADLERMEYLRRMLAELEADIAEMRVKGSWQALVSGHRQALSLRTELDELQAEQEEEAFDPTDIDQIVAEVLELPIEVLRHPLLIEAVEAARVH